MVVLHAEMMLLGASGHLSRIGDGNGEHNPTEGLQTFPESFAGMVILLDDFQSHSPE